MLVVVLTTYGSDRLFHASRICSQLADIYDVHLSQSKLGNSLDLVRHAAESYIRIFPRHVVSDLVFDFSRLRYRPGTLGCAIAHIKACERLLASEHEYAVIFEDNVEIPINFREQLETILNTLKDLEPDIIHLYSCLHHERPIYKNNVYHGLQEWGTTKAQVVSRKFAEFVTASLPVSLPSDGLNAIPSKVWMNTGLNSFITIPSVVSICSTFDSTRSAVDVHCTDSNSSLYDCFHFVESGSHPRLFFAADKGSASPRIIKISGKEYNYAVELCLYELLSYDADSRACSSAMRVVSTEQMQEVYGQPGVARFNPLSMLCGCSYRAVPLAGVSDEVIYVGLCNTFHLEALGKYFAIYPSELLLPAVFCNSHRLAFPGRIYHSSLDSRF